MNKQEAYKIGIEHAEKGLQCTPFDCREIDKILLNESKKAKRPAREYANLRNQFNKGWQSKYFQMVSDVN